MTAHAPECEEADVGSLCDCDCAGARHAVRRTKGGVPGAGQVSQRAQKVAARDGRASVVNNRAVPSGRGRRGGDPVPDKPSPAKPGGRGRARPPVTPPPDVAPLKPPRPVGPPPRPRSRKSGDGTVTTTVTRPAGLSAGTRAHAEKVRAALPKTRDQWHAVAAPADEATAKQLAKDAAKAQKAAIAARKKADDRFNDLLQQRFDALRADIDAGRWTRRDANGKEVVPEHDEVVERAAASARIDAKYMRLDRDANVKYGTARKARDSADRVAAGVGAYPLHAASGLRMPTAQLSAHLHEVIAVGRAALADAKAALGDSAPDDVRAALAVGQRLRGVEKAANDLGVIRGKALFPTAGGRVAFAETEGEPGPSFTHPDGTTETGLTQARWNVLHKQYADQRYDLREQNKAVRQTLAVHESRTLRDMLSAHRGFGGVSHSDAAGRKRPASSGGDAADREPRTDWRERLTAAEQFFPDDWLRESAKRPLAVGSTFRAYYSDDAGHVSMPSHDRDTMHNDGALGYVTETNVHELGHRMEYTIPGLTHLEFAYARERATDAKGNVEPVEQLFGYPPGEVGQTDAWGSQYVGKTYEKEGGKSDRPGDVPWEVFQTGLQDTFGRSSEVHGPVDDPEQLQAFVIGALLTLG